MVLSHPISQREGVTMGYRVTVVDERRVEAPSEESSDVPKHGSLSLPRLLDGKEL